MNIIKKKPLNKKERQEMKTNIKSNPQVKFRPDVQFILGCLMAFFIVVFSNRLAYAITTYVTHTHPTSSLEVISHSHAPNIRLPHTHTPDEKFIKEPNNPLSSLKNLQIQVK